MSLLTEVVARIAAPILTQVTNRGSNTATSYDATVLQQACDDTEDAFEVYAGEAYDTTNNAHNRVAVPLVLATLRNWFLGNATSSEYDACINRIREYSKISARNRFAPTTSSQLTPSTEVPTGSEVRPAFDDDAFDGYRPNQP